MWWQFISFVLVVTPTTVHLIDYNMKLLKQVLQHSERHFNYTKVPIFLGDNIAPDTRHELHSHFNQIEPPRAQYIFTVKSYNGIWNLLRIHIQHDVLSIVLCDAVDDFIWNILDWRLRKLRMTRMIVVLKERGRKSLLHDIVSKLWHFQFINVVVIYRNGLYSYKPYPKIEIYKVDLNTTVDYFPPTWKNLQGYQISMPVENDIPRIFFIKASNGQPQVKGFAYQIFVEFLKRLNATLNITNLNATRSITSSVNMSNIVQSIGKLELEITLHPYTTIGYTSGIIGYPIFKMRNCLIMPVHNEIERFMYLLRPFSWDVWLFVFVAIIYVSIILALVHPVLRRLQSVRQRLSLGLLESISQVFFLSSTITIHQPGFIYFFAYTLLAIFGFLTTTWYCNLLSSFLTTFLVGEQVDTFEQWIAAQVPVLAKGHEAGMVLWFVPPQYQAKVKHLILSVDASVQVAHLLSFNRSFAYPVTEERWTFLAKQQEYANKPIYRYSSICFASPTIGYPMRLDSHLEHPMTQFIMDVQMSGLDHYWLTSDFEYALKAGYVRWIDNVLPFKALDLDSLQVAWYIVSFGWILSFLVFLYERQRFKSRKQNGKLNSW